MILRNTLCIHSKGDPQTGKSYTKDVLALWQKFCGPQRVSQPGDWAKGLRTAREIDLKASGIRLQNFHKTGKQTLGGHNKTLNTQGCRRKKQWPHKRVSQTCLWVSQSFWQSVGWQWSVAWTGALNNSSGSLHPLEGSCHCPISPAIVWHQATLQGVNIGPHQEKTGLKIYWAWSQEKTLHMDITRWSTPKSDWLYSLQPKMEKLNKTACDQKQDQELIVAQIMNIIVKFRQIEESKENH